MKNYKTWLLSTNENEQIMPDDEELKTLYPDHEYPSHRARQWHADQESSRARAIAGREYNDNQISLMNKHQKDVISSSIAYMVTRAFALDNNKFLDECLALMEEYPELLKGLRLKGEIVANPDALGNSF